ncbi:hypothetical protein CPC16_004376 [Podila verticillata]|nr:hypothetical protein BGZ52_010181 [Haplosporangium bisporale]KAF9213917.1 hypothetical protein BGZ59_004610 [Podila verticillata]KAF9391378.1 hypothetical protein CPC16_004376 [Podila verticillata]KAI9237372.1 MAG: hypothetical protein BYD32DRAFT_461616 [Podila humilis]KFH67123.1 hypothetical protein MVEG_07646 [Podila verticillata NRRL 6337]
MTAQDLTNFLAWAEENGIQWDKNAIEVREGKHGLGVYAKKNLEGGFEAIQVPKSIVLSAMSTGIANLLEEEKIEGYVSLTLAAMYEASLGAESVWSAYLTLLANRTPAMASDLSEDARELMKKCEAYADIETDLKDMQSDYDTIVVPFIEKHADVFTEDIKAKFFSFENFRIMTAHVSTRAIDVDDYHVSAFVPFVDFINHSSEPNAEHLAHEDVCEVCGALSCEHMGEFESDDEDVEEVPELAQEKREARAAAKKAAAAPKEDESDEEEDSDWEDEDSENTCDIVLDEDVKKGEEITRSYGPFPNKIFLSKYGFAEIGNPDDTVTIQLEMIRKAADGILNNAALVEERVKWFLDTEDKFIGESDDEDSDDEHEGGCCDHDHEGHEHSHDHEHSHAANDAADVDEEDEGEDSDDEDDFPRDIMYMDSDGAVDDRVLMLMNVLFMEQEQFEKVQESEDVATEYFNDVFLRRDIEENGVEIMEDVDEEGTETRKVELEPLTDAARQIRKNVLEAILAVIRIRADAYGVTDKTTAEDDLEALLNANLSGALFYGGVCVQGEKQILQSGLKHYGDLLAAI